MLKAAGISAILPELRLSDDGMCYWNVLFTQFISGPCHQKYYLECLDISIPWSQFSTQTADCWYIYSFL